MAYFTVMGCNTSTEVDPGYLKSRDRAGSIYGDGSGTGSDYGGSGRSRDVGGGGLGDIGKRSRSSSERSNDGNKYDGHLKALWQSPIMADNNEDFVHGLEEGIGGGGVVRFKRDS